MKKTLLLAISLAIILVNSVTLLTAFEAHVVSVTATLENRPATCQALTLGEWRDYQGCQMGAGESVWLEEVRALSTSLSGAFSNYQGSDICRAMMLPECPVAPGREREFCRASGQTLSNELNLVTSRLRPEALLAGAFDGNSAFSRLGLSPLSTVWELIVLAESLLVNPESSAVNLVDLAYVNKRLHNFYAEENPDRPQCVFTWVPPPEELPPEELPELPVEEELPAEELPEPLPEEPAPELIPEPEPEVESVLEVVPEVEVPLEPEPEAEVETEPEPVPDLVPEDPEESPEDPVATEEIS